MHVIDVRAQSSAGDPTIFSVLSHRLALERRRVRLVTRRLLNNSGNISVIDTTDVVRLRFGGQRRTYGICRLHLPYATFFTKRPRIL